MAEDYSALAGLDWSAIANYSPTATYHIADGGGIPDIQVVTPPPSPPPSVPSAPASSPSNPAPTSYSPSPPPPPPAPLLPTFVPMQYTNSNIKVAPSDIIQFDDSVVNVAMMQELLFEDIGATELANISRSDLIDGQETTYSPIKNLSAVRREFNPNNVVATAFNSEYFSRFGIDLLARGLYEPYFNEAGNLVIEVGYTLDNEEIQVEVLANGTIDVIEET